MRAQLSVEFLVYLALSSASLLSVLYLYGKGTTAVAGEAGMASISQLVSEINFNTGYYASSFSAFIPSAICESNLTTHGITYMNRTYAFTADVVVDVGYLCSRSGGVITLNMTRMKDGEFYVG